MSADLDFDLHLKRPLDSCFMNNYFIAGLKGFRANVDLHPVFNHYKCVTYVCSYFTLLPPKIKLLNTNEVMKCRTTKAVIRYHTPNKTKEPEKYFHHLLMLYYPWRKEDNLIGSDETYASKFYEAEQNRATFEPDADAISEALEALRNSEGNNIVYSFDSLNDHENQ